MRMITQVYNRCAWSGLSDTTPTAVKDWLITIHLHRGEREKAGAILRQGEPFLFIYLTVCIVFILLCLILNHLEVKEWKNG